MVVGVVGGQGRGSGIGQMSRGPLALLPGVGVVGWVGADCGLGFGGVLFVLRALWGLVRERLVLGPACSPQPRGAVWSQPAPEVRNCHWTSMCGEVAGEVECAISQQRLA